MRRIVLASKLSIDRYYPEQLSVGAKYNPSDERHGGGGVTAAFTLQALGFTVRLMGRYTDDDVPVRQRALDAGIEWAMTRVDGTTAINAVLPGGPTILRVVRGPRCLPDSTDSSALLEANPAAVALAGSLDDQYARFLLEFAAASGVPCFWNPGTSADFKAADCGAEVFLQVSFAEFSQAAREPVELARELLARTSAAGVVVTDAERGAHAITGRDRVPLYAPAVSVGPPVRKVGAGDAFFAGFLALFLNAPPCVRFERALEFAGLVAARHVCGHPPTGWRGLREFAEDHLHSSEVRRAA